MLNHLGVSNFTSTTTPTLQGGAGNDSLVGSAVNEVLDGADGDDTLNGNGGFDTLFGGEGNDRIISADWTSSTTIDGGSGVDTLDYSPLEIAGGLAVNLAIGTVTKAFYGGLTGTDSIRDIEGVTGTRYDDTLYGNDGANCLDGGDGNDTLSGGADSDLIQGGAGNDFISQDSANADDDDTIDGGAGDDQLSYRHANFSILIDLSAGFVNKYRDNELAGTDTVLHIEQVFGSRFDDTLVGSAGADLLGGYGGDDRIRGNSGNDTLLGYGGADTLYGDAGNDSVNGGDGDDTIMQEDTTSLDTLDGGAGIDCVDYSGAVPDSTVLRIGLVVNLADGTVFTNNPLFPKLKDRLRNIENVIGTGAVDKLIGDAKDNVLHGEGGNDALDGGVGNDTLDGGAGNDVMRGGDGDDLIIQTSFKGNDQLDGGNGADTADYSNVAESGASIAVDLKAGSVIKYLDGVKVGADAIHTIEQVIGTAQDDRMAGTGLAETLHGGAGFDTLTGAGGNDLIDGGDDNDRFIGTWSGNARIDGGKDYDTLDYSALTGTAATSRVEIDLRTGTVQRS